MEDYVEFVEYQIKRFKKSTNVLEAGEVSPALIYYNLAVYSDVNLSLNSEYQRYKREFKVLKREFDLWFDEKFVHIRRTMNDMSLPATKWASKQEIEAEARVQNKQEFLSYKQRIDDAEDKMDFFRRLLDQWKTHGFILQTLSDNMRQEMASLSLESYSSKNKREPGTWDMKEEEVKPETVSRRRPVST